VELLAIIAILSFRGLGVLTVAEGFALLAAVGPLIPGFSDEPPQPPAAKARVRVSDVVTFLIGISPGR
jgi:hypothetical protein